jgi:hypothetical protein
MDMCDEILAALRETVFHVTRESSLIGIRRSGYIDTNPTGQYATPFGFPSSYGRRKGYVCLFDLRGKTDEDILFGHDCLSFTHPVALGDRVAYLILSSGAHDELIPEHDAILDIGEHCSRDWVPRIECWYPGPLSVSHISAILHADFRRRTLGREQIANNPSHHTAGSRAGARLPASGERGCGCRRLSPARSAPENKRLHRTARRHASVPGAAGEPQPRSATTRREG